MSTDHAEDQVTGAHGAEMTHLELARAAASTGERAHLYNEPPINRDTGARKHAPYGKRVAANSAVDAPFHPSPSLSGEYVAARIDGYNEDETDNIKPYVKPVVDLFASATFALNEIYNARVKCAQDESFTEAAVLLKTAEFAQSHADRVAKRFDSVRTTLEKQIAALESSLTTPIKAAAERVGIAGEIRAHFKGCHVRNV